MEKIKNIAPWIILLLYLLVAFVLIAKNKADIACKKIHITINNQEKSRFIEEQDVLELLNKEHIIGKNIEEINLNEIEQKIAKHANIKQANVFRNINGELKIEITQRTPIVRIINKNQSAYFIDEEGTLMPLSSKYTPNVLIINGEFNEPYNKWKKTNFMTDKKQTVEKSEGILFDLFLLANYIYGDNFWNNQIEQIYVTNNEFEMIPRVGSQTIIFGDISHYKGKFEKLKALYEQGMKQVGWNKYKTINLKYNKQVICTKL